MRWAATSVRPEHFNVQERAGTGNVNDQIAAAAFGAVDHWPATEYEKLLGYDAVFVTMWKVKEPWEPAWMDVAHKLKGGGVKVVLFQEAEISWPLTRSWEEQKSFFELLGKVDLFLTHNERELDFWQPFRRGRPMARWRTCLDISAIKPFLIDPEMKPDRPVLFGSSYDSRANGLTGLVACRTLNHPLIHQNRSVGYEDRNAEMPSFLSRKIDREIPQSNWRDWLEGITHSYVAIHMMPAAAAGRDQIALAALGIPCIGYSELDVQRELFPSLCLHSCFDVRAIRKEVDALLDDEKWYSEIRDYAMRHVEKHSLEEAKHQARIWESLIQ